MPHKNEKRPSQHKIITLIEMHFFWYLGPFVKIYDPEQQSIQGTYPLKEESDKAHSALTT